MNSVDIKWVVICLYDISCVQVLQGDFFFLLVLWQYSNIDHFVLMCQFWGI